MRENRDSTVSEKHTQSSRDSSTISISDNSTTRKSIPGIMADTPSTTSSGNRRYRSSRRNPSTIEQ